MESLRLVYFYSVSTGLFFYETLTEVGAICLWELDSNREISIHHPECATKGPFGTALARGKTALALASMEKQFFLALAYFVRKRLAKRLLIPF